VLHYNWNLHHGSLCVGLSAMKSVHRPAIYNISVPISWTKHYISITETSRLVTFKEATTWNEACSRLEKIRWTYRLQNEEALHTIKEERNILRTIKRMKANWLGHILSRNCLLKCVTEEKIQGTERRGRRRDQLLDELKETRRYWNLKSKHLFTLREELVLEEATDL
jgi:hypothetical protein